MNKSINSLFAEWQALQPLSAVNQKRLDDKFMLEFNYNSNHIEGNTLTYGQTMSLLIHGKVDGNAPMRDYEEMKAHHAALEFVKQAVTETDRRPLTEAFIRQVHKIMLKEDYVVYENRGGQQIQYTIHAGIYKTRPNSVQTQTGEIFDYASPEETPVLMADLVAWYNTVEAEGKMSPLELAALFHYRYIRIHPFEDGNGRIARLMVNYILALHGYPMIVVQTEDKNNYLSALEKCDSVIGLIPAIGAHAELEQVAPLTEYMEKCLERALTISIKAAKGENIEDDDDLKKRIAILARNAKANRRDIKRKELKYIDEIIFDFLDPLYEEIKKTLSSFNEFYNQISVGLYHTSFGGGITKLTYSYVRQNQGRIATIDTLLLKITMERPTILIPAGSAEDICLYVKLNDEEYVCSVNDVNFTFRYGVLPTATEHKDMKKKITEYLYASIEKKVNSQK